jgi:hypothetical protein
VLMCTGKKSKLDTKTKSGSVFVKSVCKFRKLELPMVLKWENSLLAA